MKEKRSKAQKQRDRERSKRRYQENKHLPEFLERIKRNTRRWQLLNPKKYICGRSKQAALKVGCPFNLTPKDIIIPEICPIMKVPMVVGTRYTPSVDRIIPELGYVKGNVWIISKIANQMKSNSTKEERKKFADWVLHSE